MTVDAIYFAVAIPAATVTIMGGMWRLFRGINHLLEATHENTLKTEKNTEVIEQLTERVEAIERRERAIA
jgi:hypothetical protein